MLTEVQIRAAKARPKPYKLPDGRGLCLLVTPSGGRLWRLRYRHNSRENMIGLGAYPEVTLKVARERADDARRQLAGGSNPAAAKRAARDAQADTLEAIATEWLGKQRFAPRTLEKAEWLFHSLVFPLLGKQLVTQLTPLVILEALRKLEARGLQETVHRVQQRVSQVIRYAIATGRAESDPTRDLRGALTSTAATHRAAVTDPAQVGELLRAIDAYGGDAAIRAALQLAPLTFVRPGELRRAEWSEIDLDAAEWRIPAARMKMREAHMVPLSTQAVAMLRDLQPLTGNGRLVFPSPLATDQPLGENTLVRALRRLGYSKDAMTVHGFRTTASTLLNEQGWHPDLIELQLAHAERNKVRSAYNRAMRLDERRRMMQAWGDFLNVLKTGGNVVPLRRSA